MSANQIPRLIKLVFKIRDYINSNFITSVFVDKFKEKVVRIINDRSKDFLGRKERKIALEKIARKFYLL